MKKRIFRLISSWLIGFVVLSQVFLLGAAPKRRKRKPVYDRQEIRVIRERYFQKKYRFETQANISTIVNNLFTNTIAAQGSIGFHLNEYIGVEGFGYISGGAYNSTYNDFLTVFGDRSAIPQVIDPFYQYGGNLLLTPIYGKSISVNRITFYFDSFIIIGGGQGSLNITKEIVPYGSEQNSFIEIFDFVLPFVNLGVGQRIFLNKHISLIWKLVDSMYIYQNYEIDTEYEELTPGYTADDSWQYFHNLHFALGGSYYF